MKNTDSDVSMTEADRNAAAEHENRYGLNSFNCDYLAVSFAHHRLQSDTAKDARIEALEAMLRETRDGLKSASSHIEHMSKWIVLTSEDYSFEAAGEDSWLWDSRVTARIDALLKDTQP